MAYDKVIDSAQLDAAITATANAIREKTGDAALIQWLADKGFAEAVAAIEAGGAGGAPVSFGSFTPSADTKDYVVAHDLGIVPDIVFYWTNANVTRANAVVSSVSTVSDLVGVPRIVTTFYNGSQARVLRADYRNLASTSSSGTMPAYGGAIRATNSTFELCDSGDGSGLLLSSGYTYYWVAIGGLT